MPKVVKMTDQNGAVVATREYDALGQVLAETGDWSNLAFGFQSDWSQLKDVAGGRYYLTPGGRVYDTRLGRFLQRDPLPVPGEDRYAALGNNPLNMVDPSGDAAARAPARKPLLPARLTFVYNRDLKATAKGCKFSNNVAFRGDIPKAPDPSKKPSPKNPTPVFRLRTNTWSFWVYRPNIVRIRMREPEFGTNEEVFDVDFAKKRMVERDDHDLTVPEVHPEVRYFLSVQELLTSIRLITGEQRAEKEEGCPRKPLPYKRQDHRVIETEEIAYRVLYVLDVARGTFYCELQHPPGTTLAADPHGMDGARARAILRRAGASW